MWLQTQVWLKGFFALLILVNTRLVFCYELTFLEARASAEPQRLTLFLAIPTNLTQNRVSCGTTGGDLELIDWDCGSSNSAHGS